MNPSVKQITLTGDETSPKFHHAGGAANFALAGDFGTGSVTLEFNADTSTVPDADLWVQFREGTAPLEVTADYGNTTVPMCSCWVRATSSGGSTSVKFIWSPVKFL